MAVKQTVLEFCAHCGSRTGRIKGPWLHWSPCDCQAPPGPASYPRRVLAEDFIFEENGPSLNVDVLLSEIERLKNVINYMTRKKWDLADEVKALKALLDETLPFIGWSGCSEDLKPKIYRVLGQEEDND